MTRISIRRAGGIYTSRLWGLLTISAESDGLTLQLMGQRIPLTAHSADIYFGARPDGRGIYSVGFVSHGYLMLDSWTATRFEPDSAFVPGRALLEQHAVHGGGGCAADQRLAAAEGNSGAPLNQVDASCHARGTGKVQRVQGLAEEQGAQEQPEHRVQE
jgi:hypothetical protein